MGTAQPAWLGGPPEDALCSPASAAPRPASPDLSCTQHQVLGTTFADRLCKDAQKHAQELTAPMMVRRSPRGDLAGLSWAADGSHSSAHITAPAPCSAAALGFASLKVSPGHRAGAALACSQAEGSSWSIGNLPPPPRAGSAVSPVLLHSLLHARLSFCPPQPPLPTLSPASCPFRPP